MPTLAALGRLVFTQAECNYSAVAINNGTTRTGSSLDLQSSQLVTFYYSITGDAATVNAVFRLRLSDATGAFNPAAAGLSVESGAIPVGAGTVTGRFTFGWPTMASSGGGVVSSEPIVLSRLVRLDVSESGVGNITSASIGAWAQSVAGRYL